MCMPGTCGGQKKATDSLKTGVSDGGRGNNVFRGAGGSGNYGSKLRNIVASYRLRIDCEGRTYGF